VQTTAPRISPRAAAPRQPAPPADAHPRGRLSNAEYTSILREYDLIAAVRDSTDVATTTAAFKRACAAVTLPDTLLLRQVQTDCEVGKHLVEFLTAIRSSLRTCRGGSPDCISDKYYELAIGLARSVGSGEDLNRLLRDRGIGGACADAIGMPSAQAVSLSKAARAANAAASAIKEGRLDAYKRAAKELAAGLTADNQSDPNIVIRRSCPHTGGTAPRPPRRRRPQPRHVPPPRIPDDNRGGIRA
jgi:hypothetical protein